MKQKILAKLKVLHPGLPVAFLEFIAAQLEAKVTDETQIETQIQAVEAAIPLPAQSQFYNSEADRRVTEALKKKEEPKTENPPTPQPQPQTAPANDAPEWAKGLIESHKTLAEELAALKAGNIAKSQNTRLIDALKAKEVPEHYYGNAIANRTFKDDAEVDAFATTLITGWDTFKQDLTNKGLLNQPKPIIGQQSNSATEVSAEVKQMLAERKAASTPAPAAV